MCLGGQEGPLSFLDSHQDLWGRHPPTPQILTSVLCVPDLPSSGRATGGPPDRCTKPLSPRPRLIRWSVLHQFRPCSSPHLSSLPELFPDWAYVSVIWGQKHQHVQ